MRDCGTFDYVIVGGGSAGCVLANRLSASGTQRVLLLEAGGEDRNPWIHIPLGYGKLFKNAKVNWLYESEPEPELNNRRIVQPRGKVLGGSSSINGCIYIRGQKEDFDHWRQLGNVGWSYDDVLPYFKKAEDQERAGYFQTTTRRGRRCSAAVAYLRPARRRPNLRVLTQAPTTRVLFEGREAVGVAFQHQGETWRALADAEIILAAGAIATPPLLQLSGVGPAALLQRFGVGVVHELRGVGEDLQDHLQARLVYRCTRPITLNDDIASVARKFGIGLRYALYRRGPLAVSAGYAGAFFRTDPRLATPDVQAHFINFSTTKMGDKLHPFSGFTASVCQLRPESRGFVRIKSADPAARPAIQLNYLAAENDRRTMVAGLKLLRRIMQAPAMRPYIDSEYEPGPAYAGDADLLRHIRERASTIYHPSSTCRMGEDAAAVVDTRLSVRGMGRLRVVDGSVMPTVVSGNTNAAIIMLAEKGADMILEDARRQPALARGRILNEAAIIAGGSAR